MPWQGHSAQLSRHEWCRLWADGVAGTCQLMAGTAHGTRRRMALAHCRRCVVVDRLPSQLTPRRSEHASGLSSPEACKPQLIIVAEFRSVLQLGLQTQSISFSLAQTTALPSKTYGNHDHIMRDGTESKVLRTICTTKALTDARPC